MYFSTNLRPKFVFSLINLSKTLIFVGDFFGKVNDKKFYGKVDLQWNEGRFKKGARRPKLAKKLTVGEMKAIEESKEYSRYWHEDPIIPQSPLARNKHPVNQWAQEEEEIKQESIERAKEDAPLKNCDSDPYSEEPIRCILCPKNYSISITPSWKNPKLLSQFVSHHTGLVYKKHITGLCEYMQEKVEFEVKQAQKMGNFFDIFYKED